MSFNCSQKFSVLVLRVLLIKLAMYAISSKLFCRCTGESSTYGLDHHPRLYVPGVCLYELSPLQQIPYDMFQNAPSGGVSTVRRRSGSALVWREQHSPITDGITAFPVPTHPIDEKLLSSDCSDTSYSLPVEDGPVASQSDEGKKPSTICPSVMTD